MEKKISKPTNAQLLRRIQKSPLHLDYTKRTISVYFDDKGVRITVDDIEGYALVETSGHVHVFRQIVGSNYSRPFIYLKQFVDIALENDCMVRNDKGEQFRSYAKLFEVLKEKEDKTEYNICWFVDIWMFNIFAPLYEIDNTEANSFIVYERYMHNIARNSFLLDEHKEDVTNKRFVDAIIEKEKSFLEGVEDTVILKGKSDEERMKEELEALQKDAEEKVMEEQANGEQG